MEENMSRTINYIVTTKCFKGVYVTECETIEEVLIVIDSRGIGGIFDVESPTDSPLDSFITF